MAPKQPEVIENPPVASSSEEEEEESGSSGGESDSSGEEDSKKDDSSDDDEAVKPTQAPVATKKVAQAESESESESDSDPEPAKKKSQNTGPISTSKATKSSVPESSTSKRSMKQSEDASKKKMKTSEEEGKKKVSGEETKQMRIFSETDEINLLQGILDFTSTRAWEIDGFCDYVKELINFNANRSQLVTKIQRLKKRFANTVKNALKKGKSEEEIVFSKYLDEKIFDLSRKIWGNNGVLESKFRRKLEGKPIDDDKEKKKEKEKEKKMKKKRKKEEEEEKSENEDAKSECSKSYRSSEKKKIQKRHKENDDAVSEAVECSEKEKKSEIDNTEEDKEKRQKKKKKPEKPGEEEKLEERQDEPEKRQKEKKKEEPEEESSEESIELRMQKVIEEIHAKLTKLQKTLLTKGDIDMSKMDPGELLLTWRNKWPILLGETVTQLKDDCWAYALARGLSAMLKMNKMKFDTFAKELVTAKDLVSAKDLVDGVGRKHLSSSNAISHPRHAAPFLLEKFHCELIVHERPEVDQDEKNERFEKFIERMVAKHPVAVCFDCVPSYPDFEHECKEVFCPDEIDFHAMRCEELKGHCVFLTGHGIVIRDGKAIKFWEGQDSHGDGFGDGGFIRLERHKCLINAVYEVKVMS